MCEEDWIDTSRLIEDVDGFVEVMKTVKGNPGATVDDVVDHVVDDVVDDISGMVLYLSATSRKAVKEE